MSRVHTRRRFSLAPWVHACLGVVLASAVVDAQFTPQVTTSFGSLAAGSTTSFSQDYLFLTNQEGPVSLTLATSRGGFDFAGVGSGDVVADLTLNVVFDLPFPLPDVDGQIVGTATATTVSSNQMAANVVATAVDADVAALLLLSGLPDPTGLTIFTLIYTDFGGDSGVTVTATDAGVLPTSGVLLVDIPLVWSSNAFFRHSTTTNDLILETTLVSSSGQVASITEVFLLSSAVPQFRRGDVNGDGSAALPDVITLLNYLFAAGTEPPCFSAADVNDNGSLALGDAIALLNYLFVPLSPIPPAPGPLICGSDATPDGLSCLTPPSC